MPTLTVNDFSCLKEVTFDLALVNIIIGSQGSGKSVTAKLFYFFSDIPNLAIASAERGDSLEEYKKLLYKNFCIWFPPSAWGTGRFNINYSAGKFNVRVLRRLRNNLPTEDVSIKFSDYFKDFYEDIKIISRKENKENLEKDIGQIDAAMNWTFRFRDLAVSRLASDLGEDFFSQQTFIPAGRAFFTSIGRLVAGFEQAASLDPVTIKFARLFASTRDRAHLRYLFKRPDSQFYLKQERIMERLFGGKVKSENDLDFIETSDGRKIPFAALSSGQQELLPMWSLMDYLAERDHVQSARPNTDKRVARHELVYIEEPEAHLFPSAQSLLMDFLVGTMMSGRGGRSLVITTHSPYIMSKINVFLKAGQLSKRKKRNERINEIVPRDCWLHESNLSALAIEGGKLSNLIDDYGLIDGDYLDSISEDISRDFSKLLEIESEIGNV